MAPREPEPTVAAKLPLPSDSWDSIEVFETPQSVKTASMPDGGVPLNSIDEAMGVLAATIIFCRSQSPVGLATAVPTQRTMVLVVARADGADLPLTVVSDHGLDTPDAVKAYIHARKLQHIASGVALIGFIRFTLGHYVLVVTARAKVAVLGPHVVYDLRESLLHYMGVKPKSALPRDEIKYRDMFRGHDLSTGYFYSHTLDLTRRLPALMTTVGLPRRDKYMWNTHLVGSLESNSATRPLVVTIIRGSVMQRLLDLSPQHRVSVILIARCSKRYAGARYLKRGVNDDGHVANHVEVEQIVCDELSLSLDRCRGVFASFVQVRGSVPIYWGHENTLKPKPPMTFDRVDNNFVATKKHFADLMSDFGSPVFILNLLKKEERKPREVLLSAKYREALHSITRGMSKPEDHIRYVEFDFRNQTRVVWNELTGIAEDVLATTGFFACSSRRVERWQRGVLRSNCVDCVDRTNYGQFFIGLHVFSHQLVSARIMPEAAGIAKVKELREELLDMYMSLGDKIGRQYGGSHTVSAGLFARGLGWDKIMSFKRFYINQFEDAERQRAMNLFLGLYTPCERAGGYDDMMFRIPRQPVENRGDGVGALLQRAVQERLGTCPNSDETRLVDVTDLDSDYYLHVTRHNMAVLPVPTRRARSSYATPRRGNMLFQTPRSRSVGASSMGTPQQFPVGDRGSAHLTPPLSSPTAIHPSHMGANWFEYALHSHRELLVAPMHASGSTEHEHTKTYFCSHVLLQDIPVSDDFPSFNFVDLLLAAESAVAMSHRAYVPTDPPNAVFPPEPPIDEALVLAEDAYLIVTNPEAYALAFSRSPYYEAELQLLIDSDTAVRVQPSSDADWEVCASSLAMTGPCRRWNIDELCDALLRFRPPESPVPAHMEHFIREMRGALKMCVPGNQAGRRFFEVVDGFTGRQSLTPTASGTISPDVLDMSASASSAQSPKLRHGFASFKASTTPIDQRAPGPDFAQWVKRRPRHEQQFLVRFAMVALHCPPATGADAYRSYVSEEAACIAKRSIEPFTTCRHPLASFCRGHISSMDALTERVRQWQTALADEATGVPKADRVRYLADTAVHCPRAMIHRHCFTGDELTGWILRHEESLGIQLAETDAVVAPGEREKAAVTFASLLVVSGLLHAVSETAEDPNIRGIVSEPRRFRHSVERHSLYRLMSSEPRVSFDPPRDHFLDVDRCDPESVLTLSYSMCRAAMQWLDDASEHVPRQAVVVSEQMLPFIAECNLSALSRGEQVCFWINMFNSLYCLLFAHLRSRERSIDIAIAQHTHYVTIAGYQFTLADIKHGILRHNGCDPRVVLPQFGTTDARRALSLNNPDPRWLLLLLDLTDDHDIETLSGTTTASTRPVVTAPDSDSDDEISDAGDGTSRPESRSTSLTDVPAGSEKPTTVAPSSSWWQRFRLRREREVSVLRCSAVTGAELEPRLQASTKQVVGLLSAAYAPAAASTQPSAAKAYAAKVMQGLKAFPELGTSREAVLNRLRSAYEDKLHS